MKRNLKSKHIIISYLLIALDIIPTTFPDTLKAVHIITLSEYAHILLIMWLVFEIGGDIYSKVKNTKAYK